MFDRGLLGIDTSINLRGTKLPVNWLLKLRASWDRPARTLSGNGHSQNSSTRRWPKLLQRRGFRPYQPVRSGPIFAKTKMCLRLLPSTSAPSS